MCNHNELKITEVVRLGEAYGKLCSILWHHQGGSSPVGQVVRKILGMDPNESMTPHQINAAKHYEATHD